VWRETLRHVHLVVKESCVIITPATGGTVAGVSFDRRGEEWGWGERSNST
jgi:hypothetical protein